MEELLKVTEEDLKQYQYRYITSKKGKLCFKNNMLIKNPPVCVVIGMAKDRIDLLWVLKDIQTGEVYYNGYLIEPLFLEDVLPHRLFETNIGWMNRNSLYSYEELLSIKPENEFIV